MPADARSRGPLRRLIGTLRFRITALATVAVAVILVLAAFALVATQRDRLTETVDDGLARRGREIAAVVATGDVPARLSTYGGEDTGAQVVTRAGKVVAASPNLVGEAAMGGRIGRSGPDPDEAGTLRTADHLAIDDGEFRVLTRQVRSPSGPMIVHVAATLDDVKESTAVLRRSLALAIPAVVLLLALLVWWLVGRTLRPVEAIRAEVTRIGGSDLDRRVPQPRGDDEIARLARTMNMMLDRIEDATRRQERFVADAAHELRSPLTRMRSELEVNAAHPDGADPRAAQRSILEETIALQRLVDDLLHLARSDAGVGDRTVEPVDLDDIVVRQARRLRADARVAVDLSDVSAAQVLGDPDQLARAVRNLADNAARHAASRVVFGLTEDEHVARLTVADDGPGIPADAREQVFARFTRLDDGRSAADGGAGLGLAITRDIVEAHGGTVTVDDAPAPGTRFVVTLPVAGARNP